MEASPEIVALKAKIKEWETSKRAMTNSMPKKTRGEQRKELFQWVVHLMSNLRKVNSDIDEQGEVIMDLNQEE